MKEETYVASDYAGLRAGKYEFYYGYEEVICKKHNNDFNKCADADCENDTWAFVAKVGGKEVYRTALDNTDDEQGENLLKGIAKFLASNSLSK